MRQNSTGPTSADFRNKAPRIEHDERQGRDGDPDERPKPGITRVARRDKGRVDMASYFFA